MRLLALFILLISCSSHQNSEHDIKLIEKYDDAANFLIMVADSKKTKFDCHLSPTQALALMQPLHAIIDQERKMIHSFKGDVTSKECITNCHCSLYSDLEKDKIKSDKYLLMNKAISSENRAFCANKTSEWFCTSDLLKNLKKEVVPVEGL